MNSSLVYDFAVKKEIDVPVDCLHCHNYGDREC